jgi:cytochrome c2
MSRMRPCAVLRAALIAALCAGACSADDPGTAPLVPDGDATLGVVALRRHGCGGCHVIPGLPESRGRVGPSLAGFASRPYIAGALPNRPLELIQWIRDPPTVHPGTIMPDLGVTQAEARDMAAHLYRLR